MDKRAVVIVSGGGSISPFTTPDAACAEGLPAGSTDTALRAALLGTGIEVYTAPVMAGPGQAIADPGRAGFALPPAVLPTDMTIDSTGDIEDSATCLARFLEFLTDSAAINEIDLVAHSLGGIIARSAHMRLHEWGSGTTVRSLVTLGTPWLGSFVRHFDLDDVPLPAAVAPYALSLVGQLRAGGRLIAPAGQPPVWTEGKEHGLDGLTLTRIAGTYFTAADWPDPAVQWALPHDGMVSRASALTLDADPVVLPAATCHELPLVHSTSFAELMGLPQRSSLTDSPDVHDMVIEAIRSG